MDVNDFNMQISTIYTCILLGEREKRNKEIY